VQVAPEQELPQSTDLIGGRLEDVTKVELPHCIDGDEGLRIEHVKKGGTPEELDVYGLVSSMPKQYDWWIDVKRSHDQTRVVVVQPQEVQVAGMDEGLYRLLKTLETWFMIFVTLWYLGVEEDNFLKFKSNSTSIAYGLKYSTNIDSHRAKMSMLDQVVSEVFYTTSAMPVTCHAIDIFAELVKTSITVLWSTFKSCIVDIFNTFGPD
jgi:hypothetical protein